MDLRLRSLPGRGNASSRHGRRARAAREGHGTAHGTAAHLRILRSLRQAATGRAGMRPASGYTEDAGSVLPLRFRSSPALALSPRRPCALVRKGRWVWRSRRRRGSGRRRGVRRLPDIQQTPREPVRRRLDERLARTGARHHHRSQPGRRHAANCRGIGQDCPAITHRTGPERKRASRNPRQPRGPPRQLLPRHRPGHGHDLHPRLPVVGAGDGGDGGRPRLVHAHSLHLARPTHAPR